MPLTFCFRFFFLDRVCSSVARTYCLSLGFLSRFDLRNATVSFVFVVWDKLLFVDEVVAVLFLLTVAAAGAMGILFPLLSTSSISSISLFLMTEFLLIASSSLSDKTRGGNPPRNRSCDGAIPWQIYPFAVNSCFS